MPGAVSVNALPLARLTGQQVGVDNAALSVLVTRRRGASAVRRCWRLLGHGRPVHTELGVRCRAWRGHLPGAGLVLGRAEKSRLAIIWSGPARPGEWNSLVLAAGRAGSAPGGTPPMAGQVSMLGLPDGSGTRWAGAPGITTADSTVRSGRTWSSSPDASIRQPRSPSSCSDATTPGCCGDVTESP